MAYSYGLPIRGGDQHLTLGIVEPLIPDILNVVAPLPRVGTKCQDRIAIFCPRRTDFNMRHNPLLLSRCPTLNVAGNWPFVKARQSVGCVSDRWGVIRLDALSLPETKRRALHEGTWGEADIGPDGGKQITPVGIISQTLRLELIKTGCA